MSRDLFRVEKGIRIDGENVDVGVDILFGAGAPLGTSGETDDAGIGSIYMRTSDGTLFQKQTDTSSAGDWILNGGATATIGKWRPETVSVVTNDTQGAGVRDVVVSPFSDDDGTTLVPGDFVVGEYIISDADGSPALLEITNVSGDDVTFAAAGTALATEDTFVAKFYLPDPDGGENRAIVNYNGSVVVKLADIDWQFATGINLSGGYTPANGTVTSSDTVESAIEKLDGNQQDIQSASGLAQGDVNYGTFTGDSLADSQTSKQLFQRIETLLEQMRGVQVTGVTTAATIDSVPVASVNTVKWLVEAFEEATPANKKAWEVYAMGDASDQDDSVYAKLSIGSNFNATLTVDHSAGQLRLRGASSTAGVTFTARRIEVVESVL